MCEENDDSIFPTTTFVGRVSTGAFEHDITFVVRAGRDYRLRIDPLIVSGEAYIALSRCSGRPGGHTKPITLVGNSVDGRSFSSMHMEVCGWGSSSDGLEIRLRTGEATITFPRFPGNDQAEVGLKLSLRGFKSFRPNPVSARLGEVVVRGAHKISPADEVSGAIFVRCLEQQPGEDWYVEAEAMADFVWKGLQFGHGGRLHAPLLQVFRPDAVTATFFDGSGLSSHLPAIHFMDQSEFIAALVARFESEDEFPEAVWHAVGWLNNDSSIDEVRYLTLMTAIETILHSLVPDAQSTLLPKEIFRPIRDALIRVLPDFSLGQAESDVLENNIRGINRAPLSAKLKAVINKYDLPADVFDQEVIRRLNKQRVSIVHRGEALKDDDLWQCLLYAREMIALIVFSELRYKGRYQSYAEGHEQRTMP